MPTRFRVIYLSAEISEPVEKVVTAFSPEAAASTALGMDLVRSGARKDLAARVYWTITGEVTNMVRLYRRVEDTRRH